MRTGTTASAGDCFQWIFLGAQFSGRVFPQCRLSAEPDRSRSVLRKSHNVSPGTVDKRPHLAQSGDSSVHMIQRDRVFRLDMLAILVGTIYG